MQIYRKSKTKLLFCTFFVVSRVLFSLPLFYIEGKTVTEVNNARFYITITVLSKPFIFFVIFCIG